MAKHFKLEKITIPLKAYKTGLRVVIGEQAEAYRYANYQHDVETYIINEASSFAEGAFLYRHGYQSIIWLPKAPETADEIASLAHEAHHAVSWIMYSRNIQTDTVTPEAHAYLMELIVLEVLSRNKKLKGRMP